jgi:hypothetical protein
MSQAAAMMQTIWGVVRDGRVEPLEAASLPEGAQVLLTVVVDDEATFWQRAAEAPLKEVWENDEDDCYAALRKG